jgi:NADH-quinone oxidoreductase subunit G
VALEFVAESFQEAGGRLLTLGSGRLSNEDLFSLRQLADGVGGQAALYTHMAGGDLVAQVGVVQGTNFTDMGKGTTILVVASDLQEEAPIWFLRVKQAAERGATLIVANGRPTKLERYASHVVRYAYGAEPATIQALATAEALTRAKNVVILYGSDGLGLEGSQALAQVCADLLVATHHVGRANNGLIAVWPRANDQGAWDMALRPLPDLYTAIEQAKALYVAAADPFGDNPQLLSALHSPLPTFLVVQDLFLTETAKHADVVLPAQAFTEREGTYTTGERRVQRYYPAVPPCPDCRPDYAITAQIGALMGLNLEVRSPAAIFTQIVAQFPSYTGLSYRKLAGVIEQWPAVGRSDGGEDHRYYGGTSYENKQGWGVQLALSLTPNPSPTGGGELLPSLSGKRAGDEGGILAVPITRLYDRGQTVYPSVLLHQRIPAPYVALHPTDAEHLGVAAASRVQLTLAGQHFTVTACLDENVPEGVALIPRSMGVPISGPTPVELRVIERSFA